MNCENFENLIQQNIDGETTEREEALLAGHLKSCGSCRRKQQWLQLLCEQLTRSLAHPDPVESPVASGGFSTADAVVSALQNRPQRPGQVPETAQPRGYDISKIGQSLNRLRTAVKIVTPFMRKSGAEKEQKTSVVGKVVSTLWSRRQRRKDREKAESAKAQESFNWVPNPVKASISVLRPKSTLEGFRGARQGVSSAMTGTTHSFKWVAGMVPLGQRKQR